MEFMTKSDYAYQRLRDDIIHGIIPSGTKLVVNDLAQEYHLSAMPIRSAISRLEETGLVKNIAHVGARVCEFDFKSQFSLMLLQIEPEAMITYLAVENLTDETIDQLQIVADRMESARLKEDREGFIRADADFHATFYKGCNNNVLYDYWENLHERSSIATHLFSVTSESIDASWNEHLQWMQAIKARNVERSCAIIRYHRCRFNIGLLDHIESALKSNIRGDVYPQLGTQEIDPESLETFRTLFQHILDDNKIYQ